MSKQTIPQFLEFSIVMYEEPSKTLLLNLGVKEFAYILHDKTIDKKSHYHLYVKLFKKKTFGGVFNIINKIQPNSTNFNLIENIDNTISFIRYLTHIDESEKEKYSVDEIISNMDLKPYYNLTNTDDKFIEDVCNMIYCGQITDFKSIVAFSTMYGKIKVVMKYAYFFKSLL